MARKKDGPINHYCEYLRLLGMVRKAQRRGDPITAERWAKVAKRFFDARRWSEEMDVADAKAQAAQMKADRIAEAKRLYEKNQRLARETASARSATPPPPR